jgi:hypothetical protein
VEGGRSRGGNHNDSPMMPVANFLCGAFTYYCFHNWTQVTKSLGAKDYFSYCGFIDDISLYDDDDDECMILSRELLLMGVS